MANEKLWFCYDPNGDGLTTYATAPEAKAAAEGALESERDNAPEGWSEDVHEICWGRLHGYIAQTECRPATPEDNTDADEYWDFELVDADVGVPHAG